MTNLYEGFDYTDEEVALLKEHDQGEELHAFYERPEPGSEHLCLDCGDTAEGLMHNNTWRNVEPLLSDDYEPANDYGADKNWQDSIFPNEY